MEKNTVCVTKSEQGIICCHDIWLSINKEKQLFSDQR